MKDSTHGQMIHANIADADLLPVAESSTSSGVTALRQTLSDIEIPKTISGPTTIPHTSIEIDQKLSFLKQYGFGSLAYSSLQEGLDYYLLANYGYIAYSLIGKDNTIPLCLADPICSIRDTQEILKSFLAKYEYPLFFHVSKNVANILSQTGFSINEVGTETIIDLQRFNLKGEKKEFLRHQLNLGKKEGLVIKEQSSSEVGEEVLETISEKWLQKKVVHSRELSFIVRPIVYKDEMDVRKFVAYKDNCAIAFCIFDPIYGNGQIIGYLANHLRNSSNSHYSMQDCIILEAMRVFKEEGKEILSLGFSPFHKVNDIGEFNHSRLLKRIFQFVYEHANYVYEFKALAFHKNRYRPGMEGCEDSKVYCAYKAPVRFGLLIEVFKLMGIDVVEQTISRLTGR